MRYLIFLYVWRHLFISSYSWPYRFFYEKVERIAFWVQSYQFSYLQTVGIVFELSNQVYSHRLLSQLWQNRGGQHVPLFWSIGIYYRDGYWIPTNPCRYISNYTDPDNYYVRCHSETSALSVVIGQACFSRHMSANYIWSLLIKETCLSHQESEQPWTCFFEKYVNAFCFSRLFHFYIFCTFSMNFPSTLVFMSLNNAFSNSCRTYFLL